MIIEVLHIDDCPSWVEAGNRLRAALDATGFGDAKINYRVLRTTDEVAGVSVCGIAHNPSRRRGSVPGQRTHPRPRVPGLRHREGHRWDAVELAVH